MLVQFQLQLVFLVKQDNMQILKVLHIAQNVNKEHIRLNQVKLLVLNA